MAAIARRTNNPNPVGELNFFNKWMFWWVKDLFWSRKDYDFDFDDLYDLLPENSSEFVSNSLEKSWHAEFDKTQPDRKKPSLWSAIIKTYRSPFLKYSLYVILYVVVMILEPYFLELLISYFNASTSTSKLEAYAYATTMVLLLLLQATFHRHGFVQLLNVGMRAKIACSSLMFKKLVRLDSSSIGKSTGGLIVNLLSNDVAKFETLSRCLPFLIIVPFQLVVVVALLWRYVGWASLIAVLLMILQTLPVQALFYKLSYKLRSKLAVKRDDRVFLIGEIVNGIRTIKMYVWEKPFEKLVYQARSLEIREYIRVSHMTSILYACGIFSHRLTTFLTILSHKFINGAVTIAATIPLTQYIFTLRSILAIYMCESSANAVEVRVSVKRLQNFLLMDEVHRKSVIRKDDGSGCVELKNVTASYGRNSNDVVLKDVSLELPRGSLCVIAGSVGSGKSSVLKLLLRELHVDAGDVSIRGRISYASQEPWLFNGSIRENILFGMDYDEERYYKITAACTLREDFDQLPYGDRSLVGERESSLSGGQQARINIARAVYREADVYLLDDPFSAVDTRVAEKLFNDCINGLLKDKTRVVVSHKAEYLSRADLIVILDKGRIEFSGSYKDFQSNANYTKFLPTIDAKKPTLASKQINDTEELSRTSDTMISKSNKDKADPKETEELLVKGRVSKSVYWRYFRAGGSCVRLLTLIALCVLTVMAMCGFDYWVVKWAQNEERNFLNYTLNENTTLPSHDDGNSSLYIFTTTVLAVIIIPLIFNFTFYNVFLTASKNIHNEMFACLIKTPLRFFETNPAGRILNRFSEDTGTVDNFLPLVIYEATDIVFLVSAVLVPTLIVNPWNVLPMIAFGYLYFRMSRGYVWIIQRLRRLEGIAKSPVLSFASSSLAGISTIRSCQAEKLVIKNFNSLLDGYTIVHYLVIVLGQAFSFWLEALITVFFAVIAYGCVLLKSDKSDDAGYIGMSLIQTNEMAISMSYAVRQIIETLAMMTNVERMLQFTELDKEAMVGDDDVDECKNWPKVGRIEFRGVYLRYGEDDGEPVLKDLNFAVESGTKIGVVGRTGAGKTSLISAMFQLTETDGTILIGGVDIKTISLTMLRSKISIIPQEPVIFTTTLRANLDPYNEFDDAAIWSALEDVKLNKTFDSLDQTIDRGGSNLSAGQRQLLCLARAIVKKSKILLMDEATANVDPTTDALIQKTIRLKFKDCTVLTIAHRLNTIIDSDKVLVMANGQVVEYDHPYLLLQKEDSYLSGMVKKTGEDTERELRSIAERALKEITSNE